jgi:MoxR-like ATPase
VTVPDPAERQPSADERPATDGASDGPRGPAAPSDGTVSASPEDEEQARAALVEVRDEIAKVIVGQDSVVTGLVTALLVRGHVLLEGVPGVAKTLLVTTLATALDLRSTRVQFTPDLMPSDVTGQTILDADGASFRFQEGPVFTNLLLADEVNRTPPRTQAALLESMQERQVSVGGATRPLPDPFLVVATQNPVEHEGTYPLPHAELDRFMIKMQVGYPDEDAETEMLKLSQDPVADLSPVVGVEEFLEMRRLVEEIYTSEAVLRYVVSVTSATREHEDVYLGASPRASRMLLAASRARAAANGRSYCAPDDVKAMASSVLSHRIIPSSGVHASENGEAAVADGKVREIQRYLPVASNFRAWVVRALGRQDEADILMGVKLVVNGQEVGWIDQANLPLQPGGDAVLVTGFRLTRVHDAMEAFGVETGEEAEHDIRLQVVPYAIATTTAILVYDTSEVPSGMVFNATEDSDWPELAAW